jgi:hypothetical protein
MKYKQKELLMDQADKDYVLSLGAKFLDDGIFYIENFFPKEILDRINKEIEAEKEWVFEENGNTFVDMFFIKDKSLCDDIDAIYDKFSMWPSIMNGSKVDHWLRHDVKWIKKRGHGTIGNKMDPHWDGDPSPKYVGKGNGEMQIPNRVKWGGVVYINDNFEGGEINYLELGIKFKPIAGALIFHVGDDPKYRHSVEPASDLRYNMIFNFMYGEVNKPEDGEEIHIF